MRKLWIGGPLAGLVLGLGWFGVRPVLQPDTPPTLAPVAAETGRAGADIARPTLAAGSEAPSMSLDRGVRSTAVAAGEAETRGAGGADVGRTSGPGPAYPGGPEAEAADRAIFAEKIALARSEHLGRLPLGEAMVRLGRSFLGTKYTPATLEAPGPERLITNLRELDCVTFVENTLALARLARADEQDFGAFRAELRRMRYRGGVIDGYPSRLHYFSDWIADAEAKGLVRNVTRELGGIPDTEPVDFMSTHREAYPRLAGDEGDDSILAAIRDVEAAVSARPRYYIPEARIAEVAPRIRNGDIIAATSSVEGLDVAHTGIAFWVDGELHLLHAPLVGKSVEISELPLAERILDIDGQDGIMVARPL